MRTPRLHYAAFLSCLSVTLGDFLGPTYPAPMDLTSDESLVSAAWRNLTTRFDSNLIQNTTASSPIWSAIGNITFSFTMFSLNDPDAVNLQYHHTSSEVANSTVGTKKVDGDSMYRIASVSKLFTVLTGLLNLKDDDWNIPLTRVIPGLAGSQSSEESEAIHSMQWDKLTPWSLATHMGGVPLNPPGSDLSIAAYNSTQNFGFPPFNISTLEPCVTLSSTSLCSALEFVQTMRSRQPSFLPWMHPAYSNSGLILLGIALSNITGKSIGDLYNESIFKPLSMDLTKTKASSNDSNVDRYVGLPELFTDPGIALSSGGIISTTNDLAKFGIAILNSTLLPPERTRKWMKPLAHTASLSYSVGAPWEIMRYVHPSTGKVTDIYSKLGDSGGFGGSIVLIPDYDAGFSFLNANSEVANRSVAANMVQDLVIEAILPSLENQAIAETRPNFVGTYVSSDQNLNSSITVAFNQSSVQDSSCGLSITNWISNGTDILSGDFYNGIKPKLQPSILKQSSFGEAGQIAFRAMRSPQANLNAVDGETVLGPFTGQFGRNIDWQSIDARHWGGISIELFIFDVDEKGRATAVSPAATKAKLQRQQ